jgi:hypothetical protein
LLTRRYGLDGRDRVTLDELDRTCTREANRRRVQVAVERLRPLMGVRLD